MKGIHFDIAGRKDSIGKIQYEMEQPGFWDDVAKSTSVSRQLKKLQDSLEEYQKLEQDFSDIATLIQMEEEEGDSSMKEEIS